MNELIEALRGMADMLDGPQNAGNLVVPAIIGRFRESANVIERLEAENDEMKRYKQIAEAQDKRIDKLEAENAALRARQGECEQLTMQRQEIEDILIRYAVTVKDFHILGEFCTETALHNKTLEMWLQNAWEKWGGKHESSMAADSNLRRAQQEQSNEALTLDELRKMKGKPVWLHTFSTVQKKTNIAQWAILEAVSSAYAVFVRGGCNNRLTKRFTDYSKTWIAYRSKPEQEE